MNTEQLKKFLAAGCLVRAKKLSNGDFALRSHVPGKGGGPILAAVFYGATKAICYGSALAAAGAAVGATGGGAIVVATAGEVAAVTGSGVVATVIGSSSTLLAGAEMATGVAASTGCVATVVASIETASTLMGALGMAIPFL